MAEVRLPSPVPPPVPPHRSNTHYATSPPSSPESPHHLNLPRKRPTISRKPLPSMSGDKDIRLQGSPLSPVQINYPLDTSQYEPSYASFETAAPISQPTSPQDIRNVDIEMMSPPSLPPPPPPPAHVPPPVPRSVSQSKEILYRHSVAGIASTPMLSPTDDGSLPADERAAASRTGLKHSASASLDSRPVELQPQLQYNGFDEPTGNSESNNRRPNPGAGFVPGSRKALGDASLAPVRRRSSGNSLQRPRSAYSSVSESRDRDASISSTLYPRTPSAQSRYSPDSRPVSYVDLLNVPYPQQTPPSANFGHSHLRNAVGSSVSLLSTAKTLEMYRANVKKTTDPAIQYGFALFLINAAQEAAAGRLEDDGEAVATKSTRDDLIREARQILTRLSDRSYPFAQYYLADGYASGLFNKGKEDWDRAYPLFVSASKHGHAEAGYRAALCYEYGWGCRKDLAKAEQFYRQAASKNHPGAMLRLGRACLRGEFGLTKHYREGVKWMKRAAESADAQYNAAPFELGCMHETGFGDDVFQDESYAAQLFTQSADLGHAMAAFRLGDAYEHGKLKCPKDPALSIHFYTCAAQLGHIEAMMGLCAWYLIGAEPILDKDENEAYEWAKKAAEAGLTKAQYAVGYFTEAGIGCRRDPLEANVWYVKAAEQGDDRAKHRLAAIQAAASGDSPTSKRATLKKGEEKGKKRFGLF